MTESIQGKALLKEVLKKEYVPVIWIKDEEAPKGKRVLDIDGQDTRQQAEDLIGDAETEFGERAFFTDIKEVLTKKTGEFYIRKGFHS